MGTDHRSCVTSLVVTLGCLLFAGCAGPKNPSFDLTPSQARAELMKMRQTPAPLHRPIVIIGGYHDIGVGPWMLGSKLRPALGASADNRVVHVAVGYETSFKRCRHMLIAAVDAAFGRLSNKSAARDENDDVDETVEVDVIGFSMGGIVARDAALPRIGERRLKIARLFTISTPHAGSRWADELPHLTHAVDPRIADMRSSSAFLERLNEALLTEDGKPDAGDADGGLEYPIISYVRLGDTVVGPENAAPPGSTPFWVSNPVFQPAHIGASVDSRIIADIARRLRYEKPLTRGEPTPLPSSVHDATAS